MRDHGLNKDRDREKESKENKVKIVFIYIFVLYTIQTVCVRARVRACVRVCADVSPLKHANVPILQCLGGVINTKVNMCASVI